MEQIQEIIKAFEQAAIDHGLGTEQGNYKLGNKAYFIIDKSYKKLKSIGEEAVVQLMPLLEHPNDHVVVWASRYLLFFRPREAEDALKRVMQKSGFAALDAGATLSEWKKGNLKEG
jgi:Domain of unknown function (DUF2019)